MKSPKDDFAIVAAVSTAGIVGLSPYSLIVEITKIPLDSIGSADGQQLCCWIPKKSL
ncbi:MAG: hypothetical protein WBF37_03110 [Dehalococcoidia bacterium]